MRFTLLMVSMAVLMNTTWGGVEMKPLAETQNAALRYWMAFAEMQDPPAEKSVQELLEKTAAGQAAWNEAKLGPILDSNREALDTMLRATKLPVCDWGLEYSRGPHAPIAHLARARVMARLSTLQAMREMAAGNSQAAVNRHLAGIRFSAHLAKGGTLVSVLTARTMLLPSLRLLTVEAKQARLLSAQASQVLAALKALPADTFDWSGAWQMEQLALEAFFKEAKESKVASAIDQSPAGGTIPPGTGAPAHQDLSRFRAYMASVKGALNLPTAATRVQLDALQPQRQTLKEPIRQLIPDPQKVNQARADVVAAKKALFEALASR